MVQGGFSLRLDLHFPIISDVEYFFHMPAFVYESFFKEIVLENMNNYLQHNKIRSLLTTLIKNYLKMHHSFLDIDYRIVFGRQPEIVFGRPPE